MNATELTIGDWVYFGNDEYSPSKIEGILPYDEGIVLDFDNEPVANENIRPIPLTEEIIKANGWRYDYIYKIWLYEDEDKMDFCVKIAEIRGISVSLYKDYPIIFINNVHELQHALRLCGLQELADNFIL